MPGGKKKKKKNLATKIFFFFFRMVLGYSRTDPSAVVLQAIGRGGVDELIEYLKEDQIQV